MAPQACEQHGCPCGAHTGRSAVGTAGSRWARPTRAGGGGFRNSTRGTCSLQARHRPPGTRVPPEERSPGHRAPCVHCHLPPLSTSVRRSTHPPRGRRCLLGDSDVSTSGTVRDHRAGGPPATAHRGLEDERGQASRAADSLPPPSVRSVVMAAATHKTPWPRSGPLRADAEGGTTTHTTSHRQPPWPPRQLLPVASPRPQGGTDLRSLLWVCAPRGARGTVKRHSPPRGVGAVKTLVVRLQTGLSLTHGRPEASGHGTRRRLWQDFSGKALVRQPPIGQTPSTPNLLTTATEGGPPNQGPEGHGVPNLRARACPLGQCKPAVTPCPSGRGDTTTCLGTAQ